MTEPQDDAVSLDDEKGGLKARLLPSGRISQLYSVLRSEYGDHGRSIFVATVLTSIASIIEVFIVLLIAGLGTSLLQGVHHVLLPKGYVITVMAAAVATIAAVVVRALFDLIATYYKFGYMERYESHTRRDLLHHFLRAEWHVQANDDSGNVQTNTVVYLKLSAGALSTMQDMLTTFIAFCVFMVAAVVKGGVSMIAILVVSGLLALVLKPLIDWAHRAGGALKSSSLVFSRLAMEMYDMAREIRLFGAHDHVAGKIADSSYDVAKADRDSNIATGVLSSLQASAIYFVGALGLLAVVAIHVKNPGTWVAVILLIYRGLGNAKVFQADYQSMIVNMPSIEEMQRNRDKWRDSAVPTTGIEYTPPLTTIEFDKVSFTYPEGTRALTEASFTLERGAALGLMGPSGSGKSTIVQLLLRLRLASEGEVRVNGVNIADLRPGSWYGHAVIVPQEAQLFSATVLDNVTSFHSSISREEAMYALKRAHVLDEILALPDGIDTLLGETGRALSGGQQQRVCIARALAAKPDVLVLDEPTSALDLISEEGIRATLESLRGEMTIVVIAHRMSTLRVCDTVAVLEGGRITDFGDRAELEAHSPFFAEAVRLAKLV